MYDQKCHGQKYNSISQTHQTFDVQKWRYDKSGLILSNNHNDNYIIIWTWVPKL